jgi:hypothetical protein
VKPHVEYFKDGCRVIGCDYVATATPLSTVTTLGNVAGLVIAPYALGNNTLSDMSRMYSEFRVDRMILSFIPSVGTTTTGQVSMYRISERSAPAIDPNASTFLPYVLNQQSGAVGPVWQPLSVEFPVSGRWISTIPLDGTDPDDEAECELWCTTSVGTAAVSIGILKFTYVMSFRGFSRNPRSGLVPLLNQTYFPTALGASAISASVGTSVTLNNLSTDQSGANSVVPTGSLDGDVYKIVVDVSRSSFGTPSGSVIFGVTFLGSVRTFPFAGTVTVYGLISNTSWNLYTTFENAMTQSNPLVYATAVTSNTVNLRCLISLIGSMGSRVLTTLT